MIGRGRALSLSDANDDISAVRFNVNAERAGRTLARFALDGRQIHDGRAAGGAIPLRAFTLFG